MGSRSAADGDSLLRGAAVAARGIRDDALMAVILDRLRKVPADRPLLRKFGPACRPVLQDSVVPRLGLTRQASMPSTKVKAPAFSWGNFLSPNLACRDATLRTVRRSRLPRPSRKLAPHQARNRTQDSHLVQHSHSSVGAHPLGWACPPARRYPQTPPAGNSR